MKKVWSGNLITQMMIAFAIAVIWGIVAGTGAEAVKPLGDLFLRLIKFIIVPLVLASLVTGVSSTGDIRKLGRMGGKTIAYYLATTALAVILGLLIAGLLSPGSGLELKPEGSKAETKEGPAIIDTLLAIVPNNPFAAIVQGDMLPIIFFAIFLGIGISLAGEKAKTVQLFFEQFAEVMYKITGIVMRVAPVGVFGLVAPIVGKHGLSVLLPLSKVVLGVAVGCLLHAAIVYSISVKLFAGMTPLRFFKGIAPAGMIAFSTSSSSGTLPITLQNVESNLGVSKRVSSFVLPLGATINMDGTALYQGVCALFVAQFYGIDLSFPQLLTIVLTATLASIGTAGVPGAGLIMLTMVLTSVGLPLEGMALIAGIDRILDMFRTAVNVIGDASAAVVVAASEGELDQGGQA
ncbi:dicarboxylate/amino acid:cation symporter [Brevibacillus borstelensis]|uniref:dicarboxylate/amino acid:cation symporter n=1 Tax=Brevibacillus borstelensis TaxID=45462 RepID=UPI0030BD2F34